ncbi:MAG: hypothetical protein A3E21_04655 [Sulfurimonas sp. RIFCSPHIGHO2_12_FULL_36_9]|uniref:hypothetical protein n=1 Tax=Sulfurimonas sp. RIFCSPLOWO2_12_36_12 TaxID=1802253 RepID=UPI0008B497A5|nr:hypothetical protein [Sulfurimonas sp. RIFCSPLOWO2_12_36_12]OHD97592.1 MAG: hypothetical protein A3J26_03995 [Sulfurimonas sp. RIFCSPLOWO2_02_FULL_36_28]OHD97700.1 MAG: hypothetical protein A3E21_04655 [Sulfurimonas sp. RIFCSPHIGHO2_12_FULL_36_9]OHE01858.1 MAG: hypothetical protein A2W82_08735 [Sulfurimonas sp. RIFCSPLOWO2_12_36_12]OHE04774.1 MAG: hypothetical protein A3K14_09605 [Sulfurimonas sp. RIFCSPLOWO2_12_FULL_36_74]
MKRNKIIVISLIVIASSLQADFFDNVINKVTDKLGQKTEEVVEKKVDNMLADEPEKLETKDEKQTAKVASKNDKVEQLKELIEMKKNGYITDSEFQKQKALILN